MSTPFSDNGRGLATGSHDAQRASVPSASPSQDTSTPRQGTRSVNMSGAERVTVRSGGPVSEQQVDHNRQPGFSANDLNRGTSRVTISNGVETSSGDGYAKATSNMTEGRSGVSSIRSPLGSVRSGSDVRPTDIIRLPNGMETDVKSAMNAGFITKTATGEYRDVGAEAIQAEEQAREQHRQEQLPKEATVSVLSDPAAEALVNTYVSSVPATESQRVIGSLINGTDIAPENLAAIATLRGVEPTQVSQEIETMKTAFHDQARDYVGDKVLEYARTHAMNELKDAARQQVNTGSMAGYQKIAQAHMLNLPAVDAQAIITSPDGIKLGAKFNKSTGEVTLEIPGVGRTTWGAAIRAGLIQPYFPVKRR